MNLTRLSLRFPQVALVLIGMLFATGVAAFLHMPRREDPKITIRTGLVVASFPGATAEQVESQVARKIEERLFRFSEVRREKTFSTSRNGLVIVNVELNNSVTNSDQFWSKLRLDMAQLRQTDLPNGVQGPIVDSDFGDTVAALIAVKGGRYGYRELKDYAQRVEDELRAIPAVSKIKRIGEQRESIEVSGSRERLSQYGVNPQRVVQALQGRNDIQSAGLVPAGSGKVPIDANASLQTEDEIRKIMVDVSPSGQPIHLGDLADVSRVYQDPTEYARIGDAPTVLLSVEMHEGNNIVEFGKTLRQALARAQASLPPDVQLELVADQPRVVGERIRDFFREFAIAIVAVILVTMLLLPMRVALTSAIAIPVTVSLTFAALNAAGIELHQVSIAALIVVLGMVVDDAIVIADNYVELLDRKVPTQEASWRCATEMAVPVLAATLTIIASFLPLLLLSGAVGEFIRALPITVAISLGVSFVIAMALTPMTAGFFIRQGLKDHSQDVSAPKPSALDFMQNYYNRIITWAMRNRRKVLVAAVLIFVLGVVAMRFVRQQFFPLAERDQFVIDVWLPEGSRIEATDAAVRHIEATLHGKPDVAMCASFLGSSAPRFYYNVNPQPPATNYAQILVNTHSVKGASRLAEQLRRELPGVAPEAKVFVKELQQGAVMEAPVEVRVIGPDLASTRAIGDQIENILNHVPGATYVHDDWHESMLLAGVSLRQEEASRVGLTNAVVSRQLAQGFDGEPVTTYWEGDRNVDVLFRLDADRRRNFQDVADAYVQSPATGASLPVRAVASIAPEWQPSRIVRRNGVRTLTVRAFPEGGRLASQILRDARRQIDALPLPAGYRIEYGGEHENQEENFSEMSRALLISLALIFLILLLQFRTLADALIVMAAFPLALPGAIFGLFVTHNPFGFTAYIGVISLGGLVVRNSIILVDYIHERMKAGEPLEQATLEAGERRLRPIFLTTMAAAVGVTPMIVSRSSLWSPLASVIAFGLLGSMFFALVVIPVLFVVVHGRRAKKMSAAALLALVLAVAAPARAQSSAPRPVTLDEAVQMALKHNAGVRIAELRVREAEAKLLQARADYFPVVSNQTNAVRSGEREALTIPQGALGVYNAEALPGRDVKIRLGRQDFLLSTTAVAQPITQLFKIHAMVGAMRSEADVAREELRRAQDETALSVKKAYYSLLSCQQRKLAAELRAAAGEQLLKEAGDAVDSGMALRVKALEAQAQLLDARHRTGSLEDAIADAQNSLSDLLGLPLGAEIEASAPSASADVAAPEVDLAAAQAQALERNPVLLAARRQLSKALSGVSAARREYIPDLSLFVQHVYQNGAPLLPDSSVAAGFRMEWTISEFGKRIGLLRERRAQASQASENLRSVENRVRMDVESEARRVRRAESALQAARESVAVRAELLRIVGDQAQAGTVAASSLKEAQAQLAEARSQLFDAEMMRAVAQAELLRTQGRL